MTGDRVRISFTTSQKGVVEEILLRKNCLIRPPVSNISRLYVVLSLRDPAPNLLVADKLLAVAQDREIPAAIILNKTDLEDADELERLYRGIGYEVFPACAQTGEGMDAIRASLVPGINVLIGNSGAGKSSLLNRIDPRFEAQTGEISQKLGRGRHTTRETRLFFLEEDGESAQRRAIADTPGFSTVDLEEYELVDKENLAFAFREFLPALGKCRFSTCTHTGDSGCAVKALVDEGKISLSRYRNYCHLYEQAKARKDWEK